MAAVTITMTVAIPIFVQNVRGFTVQIVQLSIPAKGVIHVTALNVQLECGALNVR